MPTVEAVDSEETDQDPGDSGQRVEIGFLILARPGSTLDDAVIAAAARVERTLARLLAGFNWHVSTVSDAGTTGADARDPVELLDAAEAERDARGWDFVFVVTDDLLAGSELRHPRAVLSALLSTAVLSARTLRKEGEDAAGETELAGMALHLFGRLNSLDAGRGGPVMSDADSAIAWLETSASGPDAFEPQEVDELRASLEAVSDLRVEEMDGERPGRVAFHLRSVARNRRAMPRQILRMHPWSFPVRLSRLTTAGLSALLVLMMTAESWELAANLSFGAVGVLAVASILATSAYLLRAQRLLARAGGSLREQRATRNVGTSLAVLLGMTITFLSAFGLVLLLGFGLFGDPILARWTDAPVIRVRVSMAGFAAALSLVIGALGASFERYGYFRHVTHVDAEI